MKPNTSVRLHLLLIAVFVTRYYVVAGYQNGVLVLIQEQINKTDIERKFYDFQQLFGVDIGNTWIDFQMGNGELLISFHFLGPFRYIFFFYYLLKR